MRIAITGGIAEGKSTVLGYLREAGFSTYSADEIARDVFDSVEIKEQVAKLIGEPDPTRESVRKAVASNPSFRRGLNKITHKAIILRILARADIFSEIPLLMETCTQHCFDRVWVVTCGLEEQERRLAARYPNEEVEFMLRTQLPTTTKTPFADAIIRTNLEEQTVKANVLEIAKLQLGDIRF